jgi:MFS family permease
MTDARRKSGPPPEASGALAALRYPNFRLLIVGQPFATMGAGMRSVVNAFQVFQITGDARLLGLTFLFQGLPSLVIGLFGGTLADILDRRTLLRITMASQVVIALVLAWLTASGHIQVWHIYACTFIGAALQSVANPAMQALLPSIVPPAQLMGAIALQSASSQAANLLGPLLGGVILEFAGASGAYVTDAALIAPALITLSLLRLEAVPERRKVKLNLASIFEGLAFVIRSRILLAFVLLDTVTMVLGYYPAMMPVMAKEVLHVGASGLGALVAAPSVGAMLGFAGIILLGNIRRKGAVIIGVTMAHGVVLALFAYSHWFAASLALVALLGFLDSLSMSVRTTCFQLLAPDHIRGRVMSVLFISAVSANSLGGAYLGLAVSLLGPQAALASGGIAAGLFSLGVGLTLRSVREFRVDGSRPVHAGAP